MLEGDASVVAAREHSAALKNASLEAFVRFRDSSKVEGGGDFLTLVERPRWKTRVESAAPVRTLSGELVAEW